MVRITIILRRGKDGVVCVIVNEVCTLKIVFCVLSSTTQLQVQVTDFGPLVRPSSDLYNVKNLAKSHVNLQGFCMVFRKALDI